MLISRKKYRVNERIRAPQVRLIDSEGEQIGVMPIEQARTEAQNQELDLIELAPSADPPVCRIMDYGKFRYEQEKARKAAQKSKSGGLKTIRVRPNTETHDINFKLKRAVRFLEKGYHVKLNVIFRGPELRHKHLGRQQLQKFIDGCEEAGVVDSPPHMEGRQMIMILRPDSGK
ncbi:MAG: translation initiation factor IF-3 [Armatimonadetes bacterium]|nr:translation initiation factor IF-3 [Armatimonadota bacterium]